MDTPRHPPRDPRLKGLTQTAPDGRQRRQSQDKIVVIKREVNAADVVVIPTTVAGGFAEDTSITHIAACEDVRCVLSREAGMALPGGSSVPGQLFSGIVVLGGQDEAGLRRFSLAPGVA
jgi:hypothetical protein